MKYRIVEVINGSSILSKIQTKKYFIWRTVFEDRGLYIWEECYGSMLKVEERIIELKALELKASKTKIITKIYNR